ncbi:MAG TPA: MerR family transcriptional regulator [Candidatus Dormibacteraeota bacterium]|jgi:MerR family redox-sensitive transcriptional activator SoxR|nr:MerR family transcriptional regulator [Candidatus Dormibacteraeota bacterium]
MATAIVDGAALTIGEVARTVGLRTSAIRYYEDAGLLPRAARVGGKRRYQRDTIDRLLLVRFSQRLGFSLSDIRRILADPTGRRRKQLWRQLVDAKLGEIDGLITSARRVQRVLRESRDCDCVTLSSCRLLQQELSR